MVRMLSPTFGDQIEDKVVNIGHLVSVIVIIINKLETESVQNLSLYLPLEL